MKTLWLAIVLAGTVHADSTEVSLKTQFGDERRILAPETTPVVLVYSDRQGSALARPWLDKLDDAGIAIVEIAHLGTVPAIARLFVRRGFRNSSPVFLDWRGDIADSLGFNEHLPNLYLFGDDGRLCRHLSGGLDEIKEAELRTALMECRIPE